MSKTATFSGLYGYRKSTQKSCQTAVRGLQREASKIAARAFAEDSRTSEFLSIHAKRGKSRVATVLIEAMKGLGPKFSSGPTPVSKEAGHSLYGYPSRTVRASLSACTELKVAAGRIASGLHGRHASHHDRYTSFFRQHSKESSCKFSGMIWSSYPTSGHKFAGDTSSKSGLSLSAYDSALQDHLSRFEEGKPADPTKNMSPEEGEEWEANTEKYKDKFTMDMEDDLDLDEFDTLLGRFEEGKPADPTKNMSPEEAKEWKSNTEKYKDKFKGAASKQFIIVKKTRAVKQPNASLAYRGPAAKTLAKKDSSFKPGTVYTDRKKAEADAKRLGEINPAGFTVLELPAGKSKG